MPPIKGAATLLRGLLARREAIHEARALLAGQVGKFTLERVDENGRISFKAKGDIDFFGEEVLTRVGGAGGPACTLQSPHTIQDRRGGMKPTKPTKAPAACFAMGGVGGPVCTILPQAKFFVDLAA